MKFIKIVKENMPEKDEQVLLFNGICNNTFGLGTIEFDEENLLHCNSKQNLFNQCKEYAPTHYCKLENPINDDEDGIKITRCCKTCDFNGVTHADCGKCGNGRPLWKLNSEFEFLKPTIVNNKEFNNAVEPAIRYLLQNHNPHTSIYIHYDTAELLNGIKVHDLANEVPD
jgi:hypothetical protein